MDRPEQALHQQIGYVGLGIAVKFVQGYNDVAVGQVAHAAHLVVQGAGGALAVVVELDDLFC